MTTEEIKQLETEIKYIKRKTKEQRKEEELPLILKI